MQGIMNQLTSARTLREIAAVLAAGAPHARHPRTRAATRRRSRPAPAPPAATIVAELVRIASERTGYEPDMLDLDAGIEADLGIDSIKRVEILTAFQQLSTPAEQAQIQGIMETLTSARTLREMADRIAAVLGGAPLRRPSPRRPARRRPYRAISWLLRHTRGASPSRNTFRGASA